VPLAGLRFRFPVAACRLHAVQEAAETAAPGAVDKERIPMIRLRSLLVPVVILSLAAPLSARAEDPPLPSVVDAAKKAVTAPAGGLDANTAKGAATPGAEDVAAIAQATELVAYGRGAKSVPALVTAAQLLFAVSPSSEGGRVSGEKTSQPLPASKGGSKEGTKSSATRPPTLDRAAILEEARAMAAGDAALLAMIDTEAARSTAGGAKGLVGGPTCRVSRVGAYGDDVWTLNFRAQEPAAIAVSGDGDTDFDCFVFDQADDLMLADQSYLDECRFSWFTRYGGPFKLVIRNPGNVWNGYLLCTN
jgi:hypothetical protein